VERAGYSLPAGPGAVAQLESEERLMKPFTNCPACGGELAEKRVEKLLRGGRDTASIKVSADVCLRCGERLYDARVVKSFEEIRAKLRRRQFSQLRSLGQYFTVSEDWPDERIRPSV